MPTAEKAGDPMIIGKMDQRITIQTFTASRGSSGEELASWTNWKTVWAEVNSLSGLENFNSPTTLAEVSHKIKLRYVVGVLPTMRINWREKQLEIIFIDESKRRRGEIQLLCKEVVKP